MIFISGNARLLRNFAGFARRTGGLAITANKPIFVECQKILNFNEFRVRTVTLSAEKTKEDQLNSNEKFEKEIYQLHLDVRKKWVFKEDLQKIFDNLKQSGEMNSFQMMLLMKCCTDISFLCSEKERIQMAKDIWESALKLNIKLDTSYYNELLNVFIVNNHHFSYKNYLDNMEEANIIPDLMTYRYLLRASCQQGDIIGAKDLLNRIKNVNFTLDAPDFNSLILGYSKLGDFERAHEILNIMETRGIKHTPKSYVYLLCGYIEHGNLDKFEEVFNELQNKKDLNLSDSDLLEIFYTLAIKNQESHFDMVLKKLTKNLNYDRTVTKCIQRLFHKKLDSAALKILETIDLSGRSFNYGLSVSRHLLDHFVYYRNPNEILNICEELEKRGYARVAVGYCLKKIFLIRNETFALNFILQMKARGLPVREHYYWPIIIQGSKKGNEKLLSILKKIPLWVCSKPDSAYNVILPNYKLSTTWDADLGDTRIGSDELLKHGNFWVRRLYNALHLCFSYFPAFLKYITKKTLEQLSNLGILKIYSTRFFIEKFLIENQIDVVEQLVASYPVHPFKLPHIFNILFDKLSNMPEKVEQVVNILYNLYHDVYIFKKPTLISQGSSYFDDVVPSLLQKLKDEKVILRVLEAMLDKKMGVSSEIGSMIVNSFPDQKVNELVSKLSDPNLKFELNETLLTSKSETNQALNSSNMRNLNFTTSLEDCINYMLTLASNFKFKEAIKIGEDFAQQNKEITEENMENVIKLYRNFFIKTFGKKDELLIEKCFNLGTKLGICKNNRDLDDLFLLGLLKCNNIPRALKMFKEILLSTRKPVACLQLLMKCIAEGKTEEVQQITELLTAFFSKNLALSYLVLAHGILGEVEKAKKLLDTEGFVFHLKLLLKELPKVKNSNALENLEKIFENVDNFDSTLFYKILAKHYAKRRQVNKIQQLWLDIQDKNIADKKFLKQLSDFQEDSDVIRLSESIIIEVPKTEGNAEEDYLSHLYDANDLEKQYLSAMKGEISAKKAKALAILCAHQGNVDQACSLVESYSMQNNIQKIATAFLASDKVNEFFKFLDFFASKGDFSALNDCFRVPRLISALEKNDELFKKYKSLLLHCADETHSSKPVISCFVICAKLPEKLADAEEIFDKYSLYFKDLPFSQLKEAVEATEFASNFYENILSSKRLKDHFFDYLHVFYNKVIALKCEENNLNKALNYLDQARSDKVEELLDKNLINVLKRKSEHQEIKLTVPGMDSDR